MDNKDNQMRKSKVTIRGKRGIGQNKNRKGFRRENNRIEEGINRNIIISYGKRSHSERALSNSINYYLGSSGKKWNQSSITTNI